MARRRELGVGFKAAALLLTVMAMVAALLAASPLAATATEDVGYNEREVLNSIDISGLSSADDLNRSAESDTSQFATFQSAEGTVTVDILATDTEGVATAVLATGGSIVGVTDGLAVHAELNQLQLAEVNTIEGVLGVVPSISMITTRGSVRGEQVAKIGAARWHQAGTTGAGVKILIIDQFGRNVWARAQRSKDVPKPVKTACRSSGRNCDIWSEFGADAQHGVGVAEIIHDLAPSAELYLGTTGRTTDLNAIVNWGIAQDVDIISMSQSAIAFDSPGDGRGVHNAVAAKAAANGIAFFASAGNSGGDADAGTSGYYYRGKFTDTDGNGFHEFAPGDESLGFFACLAGVISVRWNDFTTTSNKFNFSASNATDYDAIVADRFGNIESIGGAPQGAPGQLPFEFARGSNCATNDPGFLFIERVAAGNGSSNDIIEVKIGNGAMEYWQNPYSAAIQIVDSKTPGVMGVGAIDPARGRAIASYSSQGPTVDGRITPRISGASCISTVAFGDACFNGTSAATPAVAGYAALVLSARLARTPAQLENFLTSNAVERGRKGPDSVFGFGEAIAPSAPCGGRLATIMGTAKADTLRGTNKSDVIVGFNGNDTIRGLGGNDILCGNAGKDTLIGGKGARDVCFSNAFGLKRENGRMTGCKTKR